MLTAIRLPDSTTTPHARPPAPAPARVDLAVVIPAFNEEDGIGVTLDRVNQALAGCRHSFEVIVVNDGSSDDTAARAANWGVRVIDLPENRGYGAALKAGIAASTADYIAIIDADGTYPPEAIPKLMGLLGEADMIVGARALKDTSIPRERRAAKWLLARLASYLAERRIPDLNSGLRIMRKSMLQQFLHILPSGFSFTTTITLSCLCTGRPVLYVPIVCGERVGTSKIRPRDFLAFIMLVLRTVVLFNPLKVFLPLGLLVLAGGVLSAAFDIARGTFSAAPFMAVLTTVVVWSVGLLADMVSRLHLRAPASA
jgi:glycosyltransferase involved in cell wall biosynthesis